MAKTTAEKSTETRVFRMGGDLETYTHSYLPHLNHKHLQWNLLKTDTTGTKESVFIREVAFLQRLKCMGFVHLGHCGVSILERCPYFRGVFYEGFHCIVAKLWSRMDICRSPNVFPTVPVLVFSSCFCHSYFLAMNL